MSHLQRAKQAEERYEKEREQSYREIRAEKSELREKRDYAETDVEQAVHQLEAEILLGEIGPCPLMVRGEPLGLVLPLDEVARLLRLAAKRRAG